MKVSVIVTTYNRPDALAKVLEGLIHQTRQPHEIIIADDGSGEETRIGIAPFLDRRVPRFVHVWQEDRGFRAAMARNKGILASTGDYLVLLDGDCIPDPHFIADHMDLARPGSFFQGKRVLVNESAVNAFSFRDIASKFRLVKLAVNGGLSNCHHIIRIPFFPSYPVDGLSGIRSCNMGLYRKDVDAVNGFNHGFKGWGREDSEFVIRLFRYGLKRRQNPFRAICYHLWHRENSRDHLLANDRLLDQVCHSSGFFCSNGLNSLEAGDRDSRDQNSGDQDPRDRDSRENHE